MKICIKKGIHEYNLALEGVSQWCGENVRLKNELVSIICRYFSSSKSQDYDEKITNDKGEELGRKHFQIIHVENRNDLIQYIENTKTGLMYKIIKQKVNDYEYQTILDEIDERLTRIYSMIENRLFADMDNIALNFDRNNMFDIIQKSNVETSKGNRIESLSNYELIDVLMKLLIIIQEDEAERTLFVVNNIDHLIEVGEYKDIMEKIRDISYNSKASFLVTTSLQGYCYVDESLITGVSIINDVIYTMPSIEKVLDFINANYPFNKVFSILEIIKIIQECIHKLGKSGWIYSTKCAVCIKLVNSSMGIENIFDEMNTSMELSFLNDNIMIQ